MHSKIIIFTFIVFSAFISNAQLPENIPTKGLVGFWSFTGNAKDVSNNGHDGAVYGASLTEDRFGNKNNAYNFDGISNLITTKYKGVLGAHPRAVSFWMKTKSARTYAVINWGGNSFYPNSGSRFNCSFNYLKQGPTMDVSDAGTTYEPFTPANDDEWHHYLFQFEVPVVEKVEVYQDGNLLTHAAHKFYPNDSIITSDLNPVLFGCLLYPKTYSYFFEGQLDDIAIYDRSLTQDEILDLYDAPNPNKLPVILNWFYKNIRVIILLLLFPLIVKLFYKWVVRREKAKHLLQNNWYEQENRVLAAQMDPHFIFNSLNSIQHFIIVNENEKAQHYLSKFSRLIRKLLESNTRESISLKEEIDLLERYLEIESLRFNTVFNYNVLTRNLDTALINIPHFLIQPFIENAIWHGLLPKDGDKQLTISFEVLNEKTLSCTIDDNGIGREKAKLTVGLENKKSLAITFIRQRLNLMSKVHRMDYHVIITDKEDGAGNATGTNVNLTIPILKN